MIPLQIIFEIWPISGIFDLGWPLVTSWPLFWKADVKSVILICNLPTFNELWNLTLTGPKFEIWPQTNFFLKKKIWRLTDHFELLFLKIGAIHEF